MKQLTKLFKKKIRRVVGLMSGTSVNGIDAALLDIKGNGIATEVRQIDFITLPFPKGFKEMVLRNSQSGTSNVADISRLNFLLAQFYSDAVSALCKHAGIGMESVDLIGSHGQTIQHLPEKTELFAKQVMATLQIGDPSVIAKMTGITTVGDFRVGDVALDGQGAPLVPYFDFLLFRADKASRLLLNIGGIANITFLPKRCRGNDVLAFDTGPGNMIVDQLMKLFYDKDFDEGGETAKSGTVKKDMLEFLMADEFIGRNPPKSTGRERYGESFVRNLLERFGINRKEDVISTVTEFTSAAVEFNVRKFLSDPRPVEELYVSGGGAHNRFMFDSLKRHFHGSQVKDAEVLGISSDAKEAICFAVLANETISGNPSNLPRVTGASRSTVLGKICLP